MRRGKFVRPTTPPQSDRFFGRLGADLSRALGRALYVGGDAVDALDGKKSTHSSCTDLVASVLRFSDTWGYLKRPQRQTEAGATCLGKQHQVYALRAFAALEMMA